MKINYTFYLLLILLAISCKTYEEMHYDILRPAEYSVPAEIKSIVIVDNSYPFVPDDAHIAHVMGDLIRLDTVNVDTFTSVIISDLRKELALRQFFDTVYSDTTRYNTLNGGSAYKAFDHSEINSICDKFNVDAVLSLEGAQYGTEINVMDMGAEYYATMDVDGLLFWRMYDRFLETPLYKTAQVDTLYWDGVGAGINHSAATFPSIEDAVVELGEYLGFGFADKIVPRWESVSRKLYTTGNPYFSSATEWMSKGNHYEAEKLWGYLYEKGKEKDKCKAANNIAISKEERGDLRDAMEWAYKSYQASELSESITNSEERRTARQLYLDLVRRYRDQKKLDKQVGGGQ